MIEGLRVKRLLADQIAEVLRREIVEGVRSPGSRLPTEQQLAEMFDVGRAAIREAISRLKQDGLVQSRQGLGAFVTETGISTAFRIEPARLDRRELALMFEFRRPLEVDAAGLAAAHRTKAQIGRLREAKEQMAQAIEMGEDGTTADAFFHRCIAEASGNHYFIEFMSFLESSVRGAIMTARQNTAQFPGLGRMVEAEHETVYRSVEAGDVDGARAAMLTHLTNAASRLRLTRPAGPSAKRRKT
ncbi:GntR family transcriptional repressor for pyruvate dehydrogenase complex [Rhodoligotrophos appendicifer]|uniref:FadR/GntR family transcriptional regulator n=1 Tax=Rhodoligotrophos appendicifer TaxID=987056 RepID=UPI00117F24B9|nr:FadR/GntR family transcriptional regulator [Rhodoligotrophos appendicifer]